MEEFNLPQSRGSSLQASIWNIACGHQTTALTFVRTVDCKLGGRAASDFGLKWLPKTNLYWKSHYFSQWYLLEWKEENECYAIWSTVVIVMFDLVQQLFLHRWTVVCCLFSQLMYIAVLARWWISSRLSKCPVRGRSFRRHSQALLVIKL